MRVVIVGNGISGITAARHIRKLNEYAEIFVVSSESKYFFSRTALMYIFMGHMKAEHTQPYETWFWDKNRINLVHDAVVKVDSSAKHVVLEGGGNLSYDKLIIASGSKPNMFGWPGQHLAGVQGLYSMQDLEKLEAYCHPPATHYANRKIKRAVIVGGGLIGVELAEMLLSRKVEVSFLVRENRFWGNELPEEESALVARHVSKHGVELKFSTELKEIIGDENGQVCAVITGKGERIDCEFVGLTAGVSPNIGFLEGSGIATDRGVLCDLYLRTNNPDVFTIGDCAQFKTPPAGRRNIEQVWYTGRMMGETVAATICGKETAYTPGPWFNSAKFFDIEYQTYGEVPAQLPDDWSSFYWEHADGEMCLKLVFSAKDDVFKGINVFGMRMRHEVFDRWLRQGKKRNEVMQHLRDAWFDPEFSKDYFEEIISIYNKKFNENIHAEKRSWKRIFSRA
jgi:NADPH-dependent 2,4-dienoyl-CoA reductase/sulfur reductase-like enzyme